MSYILLPPELRTAPVDEQLEYLLLRRSTIVSLLHSLECSPGPERELKSRPAREAA